MKIYYKHIDKSGGVPDEIRFFKKNNSQTINVVESSLIKFSTQIIFSSEKKFLFVGFFFPEYLFLWTLCRVFGKDIIIWPLGQLSDFSNSRTLFPKSPIISDISEDKSNYNLKPKFNYTKKIFIKVSKILINDKNTCFWFFSNFEKQHLSSVYFKVINYKKQLWVAKDNIKKYDKKSESKYIKNSLILLCWSRLDVFTKGIDRFKQYTNSINEKNENFVNSFCCGPYYSGNKQVLMPAENWNVIDTLTSKPTVKFNDADFIVLFSRWDGFPRVLRESLSSGIPIIVSKETHFSEIINEFKVGIVVKDFNSNFNYDELAKFELNKADFLGALNLINGN